jgi:charged multivesicular body protein 2A
MSWLFGKKKTPAEMLRENKRMIDRAIRDLDRERMGLQAQEKKTVSEIKKMAKDNQMEAVKVMAKSVVRNRNAVNKLFQLKSQLQAVSLRMSELKSTQAMADAMKGTTKAMATMNKQMQLPALAKIMAEFEKQNMKMDVVSEAMGSAMDMAFEGEGEEEETDELVSQVLDEIGIDTNATLAAVPASQLKTPAAAVANPVMPQAMGAGGVVGGANSGNGRPGGAPPPPGPPGGGLPAVPPSMPAAGAAAGVEDDDLLLRLQRLRNDA